MINTITLTVTRKRTPPEPVLASLELTAVLHALSDPMRLAIVRALASAESGRPCNQCACPSVPKSTLAHHFKVLRQAGLIRSQEIGTTLKNTLRSADMESRFPGLLEIVLREY
jgi:DNA-binding transcriptional ArsR family regulator